MRFSAMCAHITDLAAAAACTMRPPARPCAYVLVIPTRPMTSSRSFLNSSLHANGKKTIQSCGNAIVNHFYPVRHAIDRTSKPVARSDDYHPSILSLPSSPLSSLSSFAHSNMYPSTHAASAMPPEPDSPCPTAAALPLLPCPTREGEHNNGNISDATAHAAAAAAAASPLLLLRRAPRESALGGPGHRTFQRNLSSDDVHVQRQYNFCH